MRLPLIGILLIVKCCVCADEYNFDGNIRNFVVGNDSIYLHTDTHLYQLRHDLTLETRVDISNPPSNRITILVPFDANGTIVVCGSANCGYCEVLDLNDINKLIHRENIFIGQSVNESAVAFIINVGSEKYMLVAKDMDDGTGCGQSYLVAMWNTNDQQYGKIFSIVQQAVFPYIEKTASSPPLQFVDGFQLLQKSSYLFLNVMTETESKVQLLWVQGNSKLETVESLKGAILSCCDDKPYSKLLSSARVPGEGPVLWAGVFTGYHAHKGPADSVLAIFNITHDQFGKVQNIYPHGSTPGKAEERVLLPVAVVFKNPSMAAVAADRISARVVLFVWTGDSQLIKLVLDERLSPVCPTVLYEADHRHKALPTMLFDPVDRSHILIAVKDQLRRVAVAACSSHSTLADCRASLEPLCGWCVSLSSCSLQHECPNSVWMSIYPDSLKKVQSAFFLTRSGSGEVSLQSRLSAKGTGSPVFSCTFTAGKEDVCSAGSPAPIFPSCSCSIPSHRLSAHELRVTARVTVDRQSISETLTLRNCSSITEGTALDRCWTCISAGCTWSTGQSCTWPSDSSAQTQDGCSGPPSVTEIFSVSPSEASFLGRNNATLTGRNLQAVSKLRLRGDMDCSVMELEVLSRQADQLRFHIPGGKKGSATICAVTSDGRCHGNASIRYGPKPECTGFTPNISWASGGRKVQLLGSYMEFVEAVTVGSTNENRVNFSSGALWLETPAQGALGAPGPFGVSVRVGNAALDCQGELLYHPDPEFSSFTSNPTAKGLQITIQKKPDRLNLKETEMAIFVEHGSQSLRCEMEKMEGTADTELLHCLVSQAPPTDLHIHTLRIHAGAFSTILRKRGQQLFIVIGVIFCLLPLIGVMVGLVMYRNSKRKMTKMMNERLELLENDIRGEIRQGFVDLQIERTALTDSVGAVPFLHYKHFATRVFFPEDGPLVQAVVKEGGQVVVGPESMHAQGDKKYQALAALLRDQSFLVSFINTLEQQKNFSIKDKMLQPCNIRVFTGTSIGVEVSRNLATSQSVKCLLASLLTVALHRDLCYLTEVMEVLLQRLVEQTSGTQPKLMLRRTESVVEKLLTNWMSICLYGFLRECVGQHLFLLVRALTEQVHLGPVDSVTEKALYTLSEDWLLWQAQDYVTLTLKVLFAVGTEGEVSETLEVKALDCDTIEQVKEKILWTFQRKFGFPYTQQLWEIDIECEKAGSYWALQEVDGSSEVQGEITMLNTLKHYDVPDGASIKVITKNLRTPLSPQLSLRDDQNFSTKYFHLIDPDVEPDHRKNPGRKKPTLKEVHLTKLLSTKVAVQSFVENLYRSIWGMPGNRVSPAVKYLFDFLDEQARKEKITDPDVLHIWKTNSLPLRFWVNILKNPQFVFSDMQKTPHLDGCLSVVAQAFMDSFSLTDQKLGKHSPTNKLLYAKDIPQYQQEVRTYYKQVREQQPLSREEFRAFLQEESKKHENEFNESAALREIYKYMERDFSQVRQTLEQNCAPSLLEDLDRVKGLFEDMKRTAWS